MSKELLIVYWRIINCLLKNYLLVLL